MNTPPPELLRFFESITPFLEGRKELAEVHDELGESASAADRFCFYRDLMAANARRVLEHLYPATRALLESEARGSFRAAADAYFRAFQSDHWNLNEHGSKWSEFLKEQRSAGAAAEVADLEWTKYLAARSCDSFIRLYTHRVDRYERAHRRGHSEVVLEPGAVTLIVYQRRSDHTVHTLQPTRAMLLALAIAKNELAAAVATDAGVSIESLAQATEQLRALGVLGAVA